MTYCIVCMKEREEHEHTLVECMKVLLMRTKPITER